MANYFSIFLVVLTLSSGFIWLVDSLLFAPKRRERMALAGNMQSGDSELQPDQQLPWLVDTAQQIFPVIAFVLILRSFLYEPFQIPSGSMMPTLLVGDFILVEKFSYGLKDPVMRKKFFATGEPERGDVVVFKYPVDPRLDYIKRVVGLPGDTVIYRNKQLQIKPACNTADNCLPMAPVALKLESVGEAFQNFSPLERYTEQLGEVSHEIYRTTDHTNRSGDYYRQPGTQVDEWLVPEGHYFVMGDNRDNSLDGRFWGFVPEENLVGKAVAIWISFEFDRVPSSWIPSWIPTGVRFERVGGIH
ncbi:signal peptidase I [Paraglaciecola hydrolytica]|uniref:Signal peptidase I n=1 Tax=Paraglaciecola hydrolytica TaxID=1799789 RepID=A0A136A0D8_9ALTE|nr:signal peptidase I [Paraglaciecola hydrolytica]KXI28691.1 S26 family signal peptidase [Paraglaciecola hydrolytica]